MDSANLSREESYLIVITLPNGKHFLELTDQNQIQAYPTLENALEQFTPFKNQLQSGNPSLQTSGGYGIVQISPHILSWNLPANDLTKFLVNDKPVSLKGMSVRIEAPVVEVKKDILKYSICDVAKHILSQA